MFHPEMRPWKRIHSSFPSIPATFEIGNKGDFTGDDLGVGYLPDRELKDTWFASLYASKMIGQVSHFLIDIIKHHSTKLFNFDLSCVCLHVQTWVQFILSRRTSRRSYITTLPMLLMSLGRETRRDAMVVSSINGGVQHDLLGGLLRED
jgi:hypothetical protein